MSKLYLRCLVEKFSDFLSPFLKAFHKEYKCLDTYHNELFKNCCESGVIPPNSKVSETSHTLEIT